MFNTKTLLAPIGPYWPKWLLLELLLDASANSTQKAIKCNLVWRGDPERVGAGE